MPPVIAEDTNRADSALWPKGTFCCLNGDPLTLSQRKQQPHNHKKWAGLSAPYDLTVNINRPTESNEIKLLTHDEKPYYLCLAICEYSDPDRLFTDFVNSPPSEQKFQKLSRQEGRVLAKSFTANATLAIDDSDDEGGAQDSSNGKFVFTLTCPFSKTIMKTPVRGKQCKHYQVCFVYSLLDRNMVLVRCKLF